MAKSIDLDAINKLSWETTTKYGPSSILTYNLALGASGTDLARSFEGHPSFHALPTFGAVPVIAIMGKVTMSMAQFLPNFQPHNHVHGEHYLEAYRPFPTKETTLRTEAKIVDVVDRRSGVTVAVGITTYDASTGEKICYNEWTSFVMRVPGFGISTKPIDRGAATASNPAPKRAPDAVVRERTTPEQGALYRAASGDLNPLHIDPAVAKSGGFEGPILTGTCTMGFGVKHVIDKFADGNASRFGSVKLRLSKPVYPGEIVTTEMWREDGGRRIVYRQLVEAVPETSKKEKVVMSNAAVLLKESGSKSNL